MILRYRGQEHVISSGELKSLQVDISRNWEELEVDFGQRTLRRPLWRLIDIHMEIDD